MTQFTLPIPTSVLLRGEYLGNRNPQIVSYSNWILLSSTIQDVSHSSTLHLTSSLESLVGQFLQKDLHRHKLSWTHFPPALWNLMVPSLVRPVSLVSDLCGPLLLKTGKLVVSSGVTDFSSLVPSLTHLRLSLSPTFHWKSNVNHLFMYLFT